MLEFFLDETRKILDDVEKETGSIVRAVPDEMPYLSRTLLSVRHRNGDSSEVVIAYNPRADSIDYAVAHEAIRFLRFIRAPPEERYLLASTRETRSLAYQQMEEDLSKLSPKVRHKVREAFEYFYDGILTQLVSTPGDLWINLYLKENYPGFSGELQRGIDEIFKKAHVNFEAPLSAISPRTIYRATNAMNSALGTFLDELLETREYSRPYRGTKYSTLGKDLRAANQADRGHAGDKETTDSWAEILQLQGWYTWKKA